MLGAEFQIERGIRQVAQDGAGSGVLARAAAVEQGVADDIAAHEDGVKDMVHAGQNVRVRNQGRIHRYLNAGQREKHGMRKVSSPVYVM